MLQFITNKLTICHLLELNGSAVKEARPLLPDKVFMLLIP
jgi:hypothetical protein